VNTPPGCPASVVEAVLAICRRTFQRPRSDGTLPRQFHEKTHACLRGEFRVEPPEDPSLRQGLFARPGRYPALVRFSNSFFEDDRLPDGRGMAIKLDGVRGDVCDGAPAGQQDFLLIDQARPAFRDATEAACLLAALDGGNPITPHRLVAPRYVFSSFDPRRIRWHYLALLVSTAWRTRFGADLAGLTYHSVTPYRLGESAVKYLCRPAVPRSAPTAGRSLREKLQGTLEQGPLAFDFCLQPRRGEYDPIDGGTVPWRGPTHTVGRLEIPPQDVAATVGRGDSLAFSPWNCLRAHEPLGSLNELRRHAYRASAENRNASPLFPRDGCDPL